jgi:hypothetical protein
MKPQLAAVISRDCTCVSDVRRLATFFLLDVVSLGAVDQRCFYLVFFFWRKGAVRKFGFPGLVKSNRKFLILNAIVNIVSRQSRSPE